MDATLRRPTPPDEQTCMRLLREYGTPERVIAHSRTVEKVALRMGSALLEKGYALDLPSIKAAALLHDIARTEKQHELVGAAYLNSLGYDWIGEMVAVHMNLSSYDRTHITDKTILYLADKLVSEDTEVNLEERFARGLQKADPSLWELIQSRYEDARQVYQMVRKALE